MKIEADQLPSELREKIAQAGGHRVVAEMNGIDLSDLRSALEKFGSEVMKDTLTQADVTSMIESLKIATGS